MYQFKVTLWLSHCSKEYFTLNADAVVLSWGSWFPLYCNELLASVCLYNLYCLEIAKNFLGMIINHISVGRFPYIMDNHKPVPDEVYTCVRFKQWSLFALTNEEFQQAIHKSLENDDSFCMMQQHLWWIAVILCWIMWCYIILQFFTLHHIMLLYIIFHYTTLLYHITLHYSTLYVNILHIDVCFSIDFRELPFQAKECSLANVEPCSGELLLPCCE